MTSDQRSRPGHPAHEGIPCSSSRTYLASHRCGLLKRLCVLAMLGEVNSPLVGPWTFAQPWQVVSASHLIAKLPPNTDRHVGIDIVVSRISPDFAGAGPGIDFRFAGRFLDPRLLDPHMRRPVETDTNINTNMGPPARETIRQRDICSHKFLYTEDELENGHASSWLVRPQSGLGRISLPKLPLARAVASDL